MNKLQLPNDAPKWAHELAESLNQLNAETKAIEIQQDLKKRLTEVPDVFWKRMALPNSKEEIEQFVADVKSYYQEFTTQFPTKLTPKEQFHEHSNKSTEEETQKTIDYVVNSWHLGGGSKKKETATKKTEKTGDQKTLEEIMKQINF